jgi:DegV family protein with EDD domain
MVSRLAENYGGRLHVVDSRLNSGAQGLLVLRAAEMIAAGDPIATIVSTLERTRENTKIYVGVDTLKFMVKGGRVPPTLGVVGKVLNLKPIVSLDEMGAGIAFGKAFSRKGVLKKIKSLLAEDLPVSHLCIVHGNAPDRAEAWKEQLEDAFGVTVDYITDISSVVAANSGPGAVAIAYIKKEGSS